MPVRFQVDPDFYDHPKSIGLSDAATALWVRAGSYSTAKLLDGFVPEHVLVTLSRTAEAAAEELVARGLWRRRRGGFQFHQWEQRNLTRARVETDRAHDRDKKKRQRATARGNPTTPADNGSKSGAEQVEERIVPPGHPGGLPEESSGSPGDVPPLSVSVSVSESVSGSGQSVVPPHDPDLAALAGFPPEPPRTCRQHRLDPDPPACGRCGDARRENELWSAERRRRLAAAPDCPRHRGQPAHNCGICRSEALGARTGEFRIIQGGAR